MHVPKNWNLLQHPKHTITVRQDFMQKVWMNLIYLRVIYQFRYLVMNALYIKFLLSLLLEGTCLTQAGSNNDQYDLITTQK